MTPQEAIEAAELAGAETAYRCQLARESFEAGRLAAEADMAERWNRIARDAVRRPSLTEYEARRWGPGGRAHFGDPRPGDYLGRHAEPEAEAEPELEIA
ncbi:MAG: hypothetical protein ACRDOH_21430 [Streptosporangiaceae bacterium]